MSATNCYLPSTNPINVIQSTVDGMTAGSVTSSMPWQLSSYKRFIAFFNAYENDTATNQTIKFPTAFLQIPVVSNSIPGLNIGASLTTMTIYAPDNTTTYSGWVIVEGY